MYEEVFTKYRQQAHVKEKAKFEGLIADRDQ